jgi:acetyl/propionyl-CoA carboxylase alpha subunit
MRYISTIGEQEFSIEIIDDQNILVDGEPLAVDFDAIGEQPVFSLLLGGKSYESYVYPEDGTIQVLLHGRAFPVRVEDEREKQLRMTFGRTKGEQAEYHLRAPMPGLVASILVDEGQQVQEGDVLVILESMKMQNELRSPRSGTVTRLQIKQGDRLNQQEIMLSVV